MLKDLVVNLSVGVHPPHDVAVRYAISLANAFDAHLVGIAFACDLGLPPYGTASKGSAFSKELRLESEKTASAAIRRFEDASRQAGVSAEAHLLRANLVNAPKLFGRLARLSDLAVVSQVEPNKIAPEDMVIEEALFQSGRPVIIVPNRHTAEFRLKQVIVCWDGSRAAARAIADAMPFLGRAEAIDVITVQEGTAESDALPDPDLTPHLARHGLRSKIERIRAGDADVAGTILAYAAAVSADFVVMGGYGHSRLREIVLGGTTRGMLASATLPILMSH